MSMGGTSPRILAIHRYLVRFAQAAGTIFAWIIIFRIAYVFSGSLPLALAAVAMLYALGQWILFVITPLAGMALRHGIRRALALGSIAGVIAFAFMAELFIARTAIIPESALALIAGFVVVGGISRALYFVPYAAAEQSSFSGLSFWRELSLALAPFLAGLCIAGIPGGAGLLFALAASFMLAASFALVEMPEQFERFEWGFVRTVGALFSSANSRSLLVAILHGAEGTALLLIWPLFVFLLLGQSFAALGAVLSLTFALVFLGRPLLRKVLRRFRADSSPYVLAVIAFSSWIVRLGSGGVGQVIIADVSYYAADDTRRRGLDAHAGEQWADNGHFVDEYTALKEMGMALGRMLVCVCFAWGVWQYGAATGFGVIFGAIAVAAAASTILSRRLVRAAF